MSLRKVIIAPDSFKGVLTAQEATDIIAEEIGNAFPKCKIVKMPIADGGEGSVEAVLSAIGGKTVDALVQSPDNRTINAYFGVSDYSSTDKVSMNKITSGDIIFTGKSAIIEMAQSSGLTRQIGFNPMTSNTFGFGQMILKALEQNVNEFTLCIGGSATTDGGCGMAAALGVKFTDNHGNSFIPCGETLCDIENIDTTGIDERITSCKFTVMCDVENPLFGTNGAAYVYGPQKGATPENIVTLDNSLRHYSLKLNEHFHKAFNNIPGAGAAGGLGAGCMAYLGAELKSGIDVILSLYNFKKQAQSADLVITGEGKLDSQSFQGKVLSGILKEAGSTPVWSICGICDYDRALLKERGVEVFESSEGISIEESMKEPEKHLRKATKKAMKIWRGVLCLR